MSSYAATEPSAASPAGTADRCWPWWSVLVLLGGLAAIFFLVAAIGARDVARGQRALVFLEPVIQRLSASGWDLVHSLLAHSRIVGWCVTGTAAAVALAGVVLARRRAAPILLLAVAVSCAAWGQIVLFADQVMVGAWLYGGAMVCTLALGIWYPMRRLSGFPRVLSPSQPRLAATRPGASVPVRWGWECILVLLLAVAAMLMRTYALNELPQTFELEMIGAMVQSRTGYGVRHYLQTGGLTFHSNGVIFLLPRKVLFDLFGTTVYALRLSAVIFGFAATPLLYWLVRRMAGVGGAVVATVLLITAPEQLYWSRIEDTHFAPVAVLTLLTAHIALWMVQRCSIWSVLTAAVWMPAARFFYAAGWGMFAYPVLVYGHALVFVRGAWRKAWYVVPLFAAGVVAWIFSVSLVGWYLGDGGWHFVDPASGRNLLMASGRGDLPAWVPTGSIMREAAAVAEGLSKVIAGIFYHGLMFGWFARAVVLPNHAAVMNASGAVLCALGLGYLLGQLADPRAFSLLVWLALGVAPAVMSDEPSTRRLVSMFPAVYVLTGMFVAAAIRLVRDYCGRTLARVAAALTGVAVGAIAWTSLTSHFQLPIGPVFVAPIISFTQPLFQENDIILRPALAALGEAILFGNLDAFLTGRTCYQFVDGRAWSASWLHAALDLPCDFNGPPYRETMPPGRREALQRQYAPRRAAFLFENMPETRPLIDMIARLYPHATVTHSGFAKGQLQLVSLSVDAAEARALCMPALSVPDPVGAANLADGLLGGLRLARVDTAPQDESDASEIVVRGGILVASDGWYGFALAPACDDAVLRLDGRPVSAQLAPMLEGVYPFEIRLPQRPACQLPLGVQMRTGRDPQAIPMPATQFVGPAVASLSAAHAQPVTAYPGYGEARVLAQVSASSIDLGIDAEQHLTVLSFQEDRWRVQRFDPAGNEEERWYPDVPASRFGRFMHAMAVDADGTIILFAELSVLQFDRAGNRLAAWTLPWDAMPQDIALAPDGAILLAVPSRDAIAVFERDGKLRGELKTFQGGPGRLIGPATITVEPHGKALVMQEDGHALLFEMAGDPLQPEYLGTFSVPVASAPIAVPGSAFDGPERILIRSGPVPLVYSAAGERLLAATPARDLGMKGLGEIRRFVVSEDFVYALSYDRIWRIAR